MNTKQNRYYNNLNPLFKNKNVRTYSHVVFSLITILILALFAIRPTIKSIISQHDNLSQQNNTLEKLIQKTNDIDMGIRNYEMIETNTKIKLYTLLPNTTALPCLVNTLYSIASNHGVTVTGFQVQPTTLTGPSICVLTNNDLVGLKKSSVVSTTQEIKFTYNLQGSYNQVINALNELGKSDRLIRVDQVNFSRQEDGSIIVSIAAKAYYYK
jgi:Tfp pilus assembly protein PilO